MAFIVSLFVSGNAVHAADPIPDVSTAVNEKLVKLFGAGGFRGVVNYGTGILISADGHILTVANQMLETSELVVHLSDGRKMRAVVLATEPEQMPHFAKLSWKERSPTNRPNSTCPFSISRPW